jgi:hypothetical protein
MGTPMEFPELREGQRAVITAEASTGIVLTLDGQWRLGDSGEAWRVFESLADARAFATAEVRARPAIECGIYDSEHRPVQRVRHEDLVWPRRCSGPPDSRTVWRFISDCFGPVGWALQVGTAHQNCLVTRNRTRCERLWLTRLLEARIGNPSCRLRKRCDASRGQCPPQTGSNIQLKFWWALPTLRDLFRSPASIESY